MQSRCPTASRRLPTQLLCPHSCYAPQRLIARPPCPCPSFCVASAGKYARVGTMLAKESVRKRMESESGISYTEFTYQLLQVGE